MSTLTRRRLLQLFAASGACAVGSGFAATPSWAAQSGNDQSGAVAPLADGDEFDVVIVGGGVSGAYVAWRLLSGESSFSRVLAPLVNARDDKQLKVALLEMSDRIGGRLYSATPPQMPHVRAEVGGMRFVDSQRLVAALVKELGLPTTAFDNDVNLYYLRGEGFRAQDWATRAPYNATDPRTGKVKDAGQVLEDLFVEIVGNYAPEARADWDAFKAETMQPIDAAAPAAWWKAFKQEAVFGGWPLHEQGLWNVMLRVESIGLEGYDVFRDALGYYSFPANWNAADAVAFLWGDFYKPTYLRVVGGYQQVPLRLVERFQQLGGTVHLGHRLRSLHAAAGSDGPVVELVVDDLARSSRPPIRCLARHVVLAMPRRSLELLDADNLLVTQPGFLADLRAVIPQPMTKAFLAYSTAWWQEEWVPTWDANVGAAPLGEPVALSLTKGKSITDLPLRQCYYVGSEAERAKDFGQDAERGSEQNALLMASYHDGIANDFWDGFGKGSDSAFGDRPGEIPVAEDLRAPWALVAELQRQLAELHGKDQLEIPEPYAALFHDWGQDPVRRCLPPLGCRCQVVGGHAADAPTCRGDQCVYLWRSMVGQPGVGCRCPRHGRARPAGQIRPGPA